MVSAVRTRIGMILGITVAIVAGCRPSEPETEAPKTSQEVVASEPRRMEFGPLSLWWDEMPADLAAATVETGPASNMHREAYAGAEACRTCHAKNHADWSAHPHRWMNALATEATVKGDFSGEAEIRYLGGTGKFLRRGDSYQMLLSRNDVNLTYSIRQTIGSRFFQYYIGRLIAGPFPPEHPYRQVDHVLPFGYWLDRQEWVPVVHISEEYPDGERADPFALPHNPKYGFSFIPYALFCNMCHTTFPLGDDMVRKPNVLATAPPAPLHFDLSRYLKAEHPELFPPVEAPEAATDQQMMQAGQLMAWFDAPTHAANLGISCEACHLGCAEHVADPKMLPTFLPESPCLRIEGEAEALDSGRTHANVNWICSRCHTGPRPQLAAGMATWNSTEFSDAARGACYSELKCIDCHSPHQATGPQWTRTPAEDDASCIRCHQQYSDEAAIAAHTHHQPGTAGANCMNCHMPRLNEGLQNVVRTHMIFSPTNREMIESNHPNACNICHTSESIDWTLSHLRDWYGADYDDAKISAAYPDRQGPVAAGWFGSENEAVRLIATDAVARARDLSLLDELVEVLDDSYLLNRQFARIAIESMMDWDLAEFGYRFYMTAEERRAPLEALREAVTGAQASGAEPTAAE